MTNVASQDDSNVQDGTLPALDEDTWGVAYSTREMTHGYGGVVLGAQICLSNSL